MWHRENRSTCLVTSGQREGSIFQATGSYLQARGRLAEAQPLLEQAVTLEEQACHPAAQVLLGRLEKQAELYWMQGKYELTEPLLQRVLLLETQELGAAHPRLAETWTNLVFRRYSSQKSPP